MPSNTTKNGNINLSREKIKRPGNWLVTFIVAAFNFNYVALIKITFRPFISSIYTLFCFYVALFQLFIIGQGGRRANWISFFLFTTFVDWSAQHFTNLAFHFTFIAAWGWDEEIKTTITSLVDGVRVHEACENVTIDNKIRQQLSSMQQRIFFIILYHHGMSSFDVIQRRKFHSFQETISRWFQILHDVFHIYLRIN